MSYPHVRWAYSDSSRHDDNRRSLSPFGKGHSKSPPRIDS